MSERAGCNKKQTGSAILTVRRAFNDPTGLTLDTKIDDDTTTRMARRDSSATLFALLTRKKFLNIIRSPRNELLPANRTAIMYTFHSNRCREYLTCFHISAGIVDDIYMYIPKPMFAVTQESRECDFSALRDYCTFSMQRIYHITIT